MIDRFASTASYYARYRPGYPVDVLDRIRAAFGLNGSGRLLDLGCGTGEIARPLHRDFESVIGFDVSPEMLAEARRQSEREGITNIEWRLMPAEDISDLLGNFRLVTAGNAFHWMRQDEVLTKAYALVEPGGGFAILGNPAGFWTGGDAWEQVTQEVLERWIGPWHSNRTGIQDEPEGAEKRALARSQFVDVDINRYRWQRNVDVDFIVGEIFSTSFASKAVLGDSAGAFEQDLKHSLLALDPSGRFVEHVVTETILAFKR
jgi:SAM-dependent methyltransferase